MTIMYPKKQTLINTNKINHLKKRVQKDKKFVSNIIREGYALDKEFYAIVKNNSI